MPEAEKWREEAKNKAGGEESPRELDDVTIPDYVMIDFDSEEPDEGENAAQGRG